MATQTIDTVIIPAAGLGTRFMPAAKAVPKEMLPIADTPTIQLIVEEAVAAGIKHVVLVTGRNKESIVDHFDYAYELENTLRTRGKTADADRLKAIADQVTVSGWLRSTTVPLSLLVQRRSDAMLRLPAKDPTLGPGPPSTR